MSVRTNLPIGIIEHTFTFPFVNGWTSCSYNVLDVGKILNLYWEERCFMICDRDYPITLEIKYAEMDVSSFNSVVAPNGFGWSYTHIKNYKIIKKRFRSIHAVKKEILLINEKKNKLMKYQEKIREQILCGLDKE